MRLQHDAVCGSADGQPERFKVSLRVLRVAAFLVTRNRGGRANMTRNILFLMLLACGPLVCRAALGASTGSAKLAASVFDTPVSEDNLDTEAFAAWVDGKQAPIALADGPRHCLWT